MHRPLDAGCTRAIGAVVARFVHTEEVTGSNPVSPTKKGPRISGGLLRFWGFLDGSVVSAWDSRMSSLTTYVPRSKVTSQGPRYQADTTQPIAAVRGARGFSVGSTRRTHQVATLWAAHNMTLAHRSWMAGTARAGLGVRAPSAVTVSSFRIIFRSCHNYLVSINAS